MARLACVDIPALPLQLLGRRHPEWADIPVAVVAEESPQARLLWVNERARRLRILPGMRYTTALSLSRRIARRRRPAGRDRRRRPADHRTPATLLPAHRAQRRGAGGVLARRRRTRSECSGPPPAGVGRSATAFAGSDFPPGWSSASPATAPTPSPAPAPPRPPILSCSKAPPRSGRLPAPRRSTGWASRRSSATTWRSSAWRRWATSSRCPRAGFASDSTSRPRGSTTWPPARPGPRCSPRRLPSGW